MTIENRRLFFNPQWITVLVCLASAASILIYGGRILERIDNIGSVAKAVPGIDKRLSKVEFILKIPPSPPPPPAETPLTYDF